MQALNARMIDAASRPSFWSLFCSAIEVCARRRKVLVEQGRVLRKFKHVGLWAQPFRRKEWCSSSIAKRLYQIGKAKRDVPCVLPR
jgi:hypothetical protein